MKLKYEIDHEVARHINNCLLQINIPGQLAHVHVEALEAIDSPKNKKEFENFIKEEQEKAEAAQKAAQDAKTTAAQAAMKKVAEKAAANPKK